MIPADEDPDVWSWRREWFYPDIAAEATDLLTWGVLVAFRFHYRCPACNLGYPYCIPKVCCGLHQDMWGGSHPVHAARGPVCVCPQPAPDGLLF